MLTSMSAQVPPTAAALVVGALDGDRDALEALARVAGRTSYLCALQISRDRQLAEDAAQDATEQFIQTLDRFDPRRPMEPWLYQIVRNRIRDLRRRERVRRHESLDAWLESGASAGGGRPVTDRSATPAEAVEQSELRRQIWEAVSSLSDAHREIFVLRDHHGLSYREIAGVLGIPEGTVMSRLHAARRQLRMLLAVTREEQ